MAKKIPDSSKNTLSFYIDSWLEECRLEDLSPRTILDYREKIARFVWWWGHTGYEKQLGPNPQAVTIKEAREFAAYLKTPQTARWGSSESNSDLSPASRMSERGPK